MIPRALGEHVAVKFIPNAEEKTQAGIILAKDDRKRNGDIVFLATGQITSIGKDVDLEVKVGDTIVYTPIDANTFISKDGRYDILHYKFVKGIL